MELPLPDMVTDQVKLHVDWFWTFLFHRVIDDSFSTWGVCLDVGRWLWVIKDFKALAESAPILCIVEKGSHFSLNGRDHHIVHYAAVDVDSHIQCWSQGI